MLILRKHRTVVGFCEAIGVHRNAMSHILRQGARGSEHVRVAACKGLGLTEAQFDSSIDAEQAFLRSRS